MIAEKNTAVIEAAKTFLQMFVAQCSQCANRAGSFNPGGGGGTPLFGLYGDMPLDRVWFFGLAVLNRVYNLTCLCPKQGMVLRAERL